MSKVTKNLLPPEWWYLGAESWNQLVCALDLLGLSKLNQIKDPDNWIMINGGSSNNNYHLSIEHHSYFIQLLSLQKQIMLPEQNSQSINCSLEQLTALEDWLVVCHAESATFKIYDWVSGINSTRDYFNSLIGVSELCDFLTKLHSTDNVFPELDIQAHLDNYYKQGLIRQPHQSVEIKKLYQQALLYSKKFTASCNCHNDLSPGNILLAGQLKIIDWEYATLGDPIFDLAGICVNFKFSPMQEKMLIRIYSEKSNRHVEPDYFNEMKGLYQCIEKLWSL